MEYTVMACFSGRKQNELHVQLGGIFLSVLHRSKRLHMATFQCLIEVLRACHADAVRVRHFGDIYPPLYCRRDVHVVRSDPRSYS